jgi:Flp pilus assembly protein TadB
MTCERCGAELTRPGRWCADCERQYDTWSRQYAADIIWQAFSGAGLAMLVALGLPILGVSPIVGVAGVLAGLGTFLSLRTWSKRRRRTQFLATSLPRAYLPSKT